MFRQPRSRFELRYASWHASGRSDSRRSGTANLAPCEVILVRVASFTFRFTTTKQLRECIAYYEQQNSELTVGVMGSFANYHATMLIQQGTLSDGMSGGWDHED
jgi:hypothetical protein